VDRAGPFEVGLQERDGEDALDEAGRRPGVQPAPGRDDDRPLRHGALQSSAGLNAITAGRAVATLGHVQERKPVAAAVVLAGGQGSRMGASVNKAYLPLAGAHVVSWSLRTVCRLAEVGPVVLVIRDDDAELAARVVAEVGELAGSGGVSRIELVAGGATRQGSEHAALDALAERILRGTVDVVALHDGARPLASPALWHSAIDAAARWGGAIPGIPVGPVVAVTGGVLARPPTSARAAAAPAAAAADLVRVQTPQAFRAGPLLAAYEVARRGGVEATDTAGTVRACGDLDVRVVPGSPLNLKITYPHDLAVAERLMAAHPL